MAILVQIQTIPACPLVVDSIGAVVVTVDGGADDVVVFSELFSKFVAGFFRPSSGLPLASPAFAAAQSLSVNRNIEADAALAKSIADTLVRIVGVSREFNMVGFWLLL